MDRLTESQYVTSYEMWQASLTWNLVEPNTEARRSRKGFGSCLPSRHPGIGPYLTSPEDDPVLVLRSMVLMILQLLPLDAHSHGPQLFIHAKVIGML